MCVVDLVVVVVVVVGAVGLEGGGSAPSSTPFCCDGTDDPFVGVRRAAFEDEVCCSVGPLDAVVLVLVLVVVGLRTATAAAAATAAVTLVDLLLVTALAEEDGGPEDGSPGDAWTMV